MSRHAWRLALPLTLAAAAWAIDAGAQVSASNLLEARAGYDPFDFSQAKDRYGLYDGLDLGYFGSGARIGLRFETARNSQGQFEYGALTRRFAEWKDGDANAGARVRAGNFETILGRGLIHRSFEVPGVVLDPPGEDSPYAFTRDVDGVLLEGHAGPVAARALAGSPNGGVQSPAVERLGGTPRYEGSIAGGQLVYSPGRGAELGAAYLASHVNSGVTDTRQELASGFVALDPLRALGTAGGAALPLYVEYAQSNAGLRDWFRLRTGDDTPHALYASANLIAGRFALAGEWKDYRDFRLGTNDPPSLVREHGYALLNRNTHILNATSEQGFQLEGTATAPAWGSITLNRSRSDGRLGSRATRFEESYAEVHVPGEAPAPWNATLFYARGRDTFTFIRSSEVLGGAGTWRATEDWSLTLDLERRTARRVPDTGLRDEYVAANVQRAGLGSLGVVWERTSDPLEATPERPDDPRVFLSGVMTARLSARQEASLTVGSRRGGLACTAGTCYEVPAFRGVEVRLTSRL